MYISYGYICKRSKFLLHLKPLCLIQILLILEAKWLKEPK